MLHAFLEYNKGDIDKRPCFCNAVNNYQYKNGPNNVLSSTKRYPLWRRPFIEQGISNLLLATIPLSFAISVWECVVWAEVTHGVHHKGPSKNHTSYTLISTITRLAASRPISTVTRADFITNPTISLGSPSTAPYMDCAGFFSPSAYSSAVYSVKTWAVKDELSDDRNRLKSG